MTAECYIIEFLVKGRAPFFVHSKKSINTGKVETMLLKKWAFLLIAPTLFSAFAHGESEDEVRRAGFAEHQKDEEQFDRVRQQGERAFLEQLEQWEVQRKKDTDEYIHDRKPLVTSDSGPAAKEDAEIKKDYQIQYDKDRAEYLHQKEVDLKEESHNKNLPTEMHELGLDENLPRYDFKKRMSMAANRGSKSGSSGKGGSSPSSSGSPSFPAAPNFPDFEPNNGGNNDFNNFVPPPPNPGEEFETPPPPPPMPFDGDFGGGVGGNPGESYAPPALPNIPDNGNF